MKQFNPSTIQYINLAKIRAEVEELREQCEAADRSGDSPYFTEGISRELSKLTEFLECFEGDNLQGVILSFAEALGSEQLAALDLRLRQMLKQAEEDLENARKTLKYSDLYEPFKRKERIERAICIIDNIFL